MEQTFTADFFAKAGKKGQKHLKKKLGKKGYTEMKRQAGKLGGFAKARRKKLSTQDVMTP